MSILASLNHCNIVLFEGKYTLEVRTYAMRDFIVNMASKSGLIVDVIVKPSPRYFSSPEKHLEHLKESNELFKEFVTTLGLKLINPT